MGGSSSTPAPPPAPDYSGLIKASTDASNKQYALEQQQFDWAKNAYAQNLAQNQPIIDQQLAIAKTNAANAAQDRALYEATTVPLLNEQAQEAQQYNNPAFREQQMGAAGAAVGQSFDAARDNATRDLESYGIDPSSTRYGALDLGVRMQQAAATAGAENQAGLQVDATGRALIQQAIQNGQITQGQVGGQYNTALQGNAAGANTGLATTASGASTMGTPSQFGSLSNTTLNTAGALQGQQFANQQTNYQDQYQANQASSQAWGALGATLFGGATTLGAAALKSPFLFAADGGAIPSMAPTSAAAAPAVGPAASAPAMATPAAPQSRFVFSASGGDVPTPGGAIPAGASPSRGQATDDVSARLTAGEFVMPKDVTSWMGEEKLQKMIQKSRQDRQGAVAKPAVGPARPQAPTFQSRPVTPNGAIGGRPQQAGAI
jgi:hypothetical protein